MIKVIITIEEQESGDVEVDAQAHAGRNVTHNEKQHSTLLYKTLGSMGELLLNKAKNGHMVAEDDVAGIVGKEIENWWDKLLRRQDTRGKEREA